MEVLLYNNLIKMDTPVDWAGESSLMVDVKYLGEDLAPLEAT